MHMIAARVTVQWTPRKADNTRWRKELTPSRTTDKLFTEVLSRSLHWPEKSSPSIIRPTESTNMYPWGSQGLNYQPKNMHRLDLGVPAAYAADAQFHLHTGPEHLELGLAQKSLPVCGICFTSKRHEVPRWGWGYPEWGPNLLRGEGKQRFEKDCGRGT